MGLLSVKDLRHTLCCTQVDLIVEHSILIVEHSICADVAEQHE